MCKEIILTLYLFEVRKNKSQEMITKIFKHLNYRNLGL